MTSSGRQYPDGPLEAPPGLVLPDDWPECSLNFWPEAAAAFLDSLYSEPEPGPPYVHTLVPPDPIGQDEDGNDIYPEPGPAYTLTRRPVADVVAEAGFGPVPHRIEVTAEFCQCAACKRERCEP